MRNYKKVLAATLAMAMVAGNSVLAAAPGNSYMTGSNVDKVTSSDTQGTVSGGGQMEGQVSKDVFCVTVPTQITDAGGASTYDGFTFVMDPQKLITATQATKYVDATTPLAKGFVEGKTLYFTKRTDEILDNVSDYALITNKSSIAVDIAIKAEMKNHTGITMSSSDEFEDDSVSMYMAVIGNGKETAIGETSAAEVAGTIPAAGDGAYEIAYDDTAGDYEYKLVGTDPSLFSTYEFALTGSCSEGEGWLDLPSTVAPEVELTWKVEPSTAPTEAAPSLAQTSFARPASGDLDIAVNLGAGDLAATRITSISFINPTTSAEQIVKDTNYTFADGTLTLKSNLFLNLTADRTYTITFNDDAKTTVQFTITI